MLMPLMEMDERELHLFQRIFQKRAAIVNSGSVHEIQCEYRLVAAFGCDSLLPSMVCVLSSFNLFFCLDCKCIKYRLFHKLMLEKTNHIIEWLSPNALCLLKLQMLLGTVLIICHCLLHTVSNRLKRFSSLSYSKIWKNIPKLLLETWKLQQKIALGRKTFTSLGV